MPGYSFEDEPKQSKGYSYVDEPPAPPKSLLQRGDEAVSAFTNKLARDYHVGGASAFGKIGATLLYPVDAAIDAIKGDRGQNIESTITGKKPMTRNEERRQSIEGFIGDLGGDKDAAAYGAGGLAVNLAATGGIGGLVKKAGFAAAPAMLANSPRAAQLLESVATSGMRTGAPAAATLGGKAIDLGIRSAGGGITGGLSSALVDPEHAGTGAAIGAALPGGLRIAGAAGGLLSSAAESAAQRLMQSAIKPTIAQLRDGSAGTAVDTLLKYGINPTRGGVGKLRDMIGGINDDIATRIGNSNATVSKSKVIDTLADLRQRTAQQVSPTSDLNAIENVANDFAGHPQIAGDAIPVALAQKLKQGTYQALSKKYGTIGSAETEAQKGLARGLKNGIADAVPEVGALNAEESRLISTLKVSERRALMEMNKNPVGLAGLAHNPAAWAAMMADKSSLFKSLAARSLNSVATAPRQTSQLLENSFLDNPLLSRVPNAWDLE